MLIIMTDQQTEFNNGGGWTRVASRKQRREHHPPLLQEPNIRAVKKYWDGFDKQRHERWYVELSNGFIISNTNNEYSFWARSYYPNSLF